MGTYKEKYYIGEKLQAAIKEKNITVTQFASDIGINRVTVQYYISNKKCPSLETIQKIANYLELPTEYFIEDEVTLNLSESISELVAGTLDSIKVKRYYKHALKRLNDTFDQLDYRGQLDITTDLVMMINEIQEGTKTFDIKEDWAQLVQIKQLLDKNEINLSTDEIKDKLRQTESEGVIISKEFKSYKDGLDAGIQLAKTKKIN
ncbi:MAG: helix-turn-helix transcriptional regulator [Firmicutes bacterium]|nr:helix-turn-helix transcriptional regulator [Bacillota bacterium]